MTIHLSISLRSLQLSLGEADYVKRSHVHLIKVLYHGYRNLTTLNNGENKKYLQRRSAPPTAETCNLKPFEHNYIYIIISAVICFLRVPLIHTIQKHSYQPSFKGNCTIFSED